MDKDFGKLIHSSKPNNAEPKKGLFSFLKKTYVNEVDVFEKGLKLKAKVGTRDVHYSELLGISDSVHRHVNNPSNARTFQIEVRGEKQNALFNYINEGDIQDFALVADTITDTYTAFLLDGLTKANIAQANISFTDSVSYVDFELKNGKFMYGRIFGKKKETDEIAVSDITSVRISPGIVDLMRQKNGKEKTWQSLPLLNTLNIRVLYSIVHDIMQK